MTYSYLQDTDERRILINQHDPIVFRSSIENSYQYSESTFVIRQRDRVQNK